MLSQVIKKFAQERGLPIIDVKLSQSQHSDFLGQPLSEISIGDVVLMEYAEGIMETVVVTEVQDGHVYGEGDDGEPYCAPIENCDKVPF